MISGMLTQPSAQIVADSISPEGIRLTTFEVTMHRFVLAEFNTHRVFSRNSASSRAIPVGKQLARVSSDPAFPIKWPSEQPGMSGGTELEGWDLQAAHDVFREFQRSTVDNIESYLDAVADHYGIDRHTDDPDEIDELKRHTLHKSLLNRLIEPIMWHKVIVTATEWENFYRQRVSPLAQPEIEVAAAAMQALEASEPTALAYGEWHCPYLSNEELDDLLTANDGSWEEAKQISSARCARVSFLTHDGKRDFAVDLGLYGKLVSADPPHWSPLEHVATPWAENIFKAVGRDGNQMSLPLVGNLLGYQQFRHEGAVILGQGSW